MEEQCIPDSIFDKDRLEIHRKYSLNLSFDSADPDTEEDLDSTTVGSVV